MFSGWQPPEVLNNQEYDESADVYSFGIIMWELVSLERPFAGWFLLLLPNLLLAYFWLTFGLLLAYFWLTFGLLFTYFSLTFHLLFTFSLLFIFTTTITLSCRHLSFHSTSSYKSNSLSYLFTEYDSRFKNIFAKREAITGGLRPTIPPNVHPQYIKLMQKCWDSVPSVRPDFIEILMELVTIRDGNTDRRSQRGSIIGANRTSAIGGTPTSASSVLPSFIATNYAPTIHRNTTKIHNMNAKPKSKHSVEIEAGSVGRDKLNVSVFILFYFILFFYFFIF
jgi:serine/threonine protein kinase